MNSSSSTISIHWRLLAGILIAAMAVQPRAFANPAAPVIRHGAAEFNFDNPAHLLIQQGSDKLIVDWGEFNISAGELTQFIQPGSGSAALNRVMSALPSSIQGQLQANGRVLLINPNGVLIGPGGRIDTAGFIASTLDVSDTDFLAGGDLHFQGDSLAKVVNLGTINAIDGGDIFLIAREVVNAGTLNAPEGTVGLAAGQQIVIAAQGEERVAILPEGQEGSVTNTGTIQAATAELKAAGGNEYALAVNNTGLVRAKGFEKRGGRIYLSVGGGKGRIVNTGTLKARMEDNSGGLVQITHAGEMEGAGVDIGGQVDVKGDVGSGGMVLVNAPGIHVLEGASIDASGKMNGGQIALHSAGDEGTMIDGKLLANGSSGDGGFIHVTGSFIGLGASGEISANGGNGGGFVLLGADPEDSGSGQVESSQIVLAPGSRISANGVSGDGGMVLINGARDSNVMLGGEISASSDAGVGGQVMAFGGNVSLGSAALIDAGGDLGGGQVYIGGGQQGLEANKPNAQNTFVEAGARILANAGTYGDGGKIIFWSDGSTYFDGLASAQGGALGGDGGFIETSGATQLGVGSNAFVNALAPNGKVGDWLLDPKTVIVATGGGATLAQIANAGDTTSDLTVDPGTLNSAAANVNIFATDTITFTNAVNMTNAGVGLNAQAGDLITVNASVTTNNGDITLLGDNLSINSAIDAGTAIVTLAASTAGQLIELGGADAVGTLGLTDAELDLVSAGILRVGSLNSGDILVGTGAGDEISPAGISTFSLISGEDIVDGGGFITASNLAFTAAGAVGTIGDAINFDGVTTLAGTSGAGRFDVFGGVDFGGTVTIGTVDGLVGINAGTDVVDVGNVGDIIINENVSAQSAVIFEARGGSLLDNNATINGGVVTFRANKLTLLDGVINASGVDIAATAAGVDLDLGSTTDAGAGIELSMAELDTITTAGTVKIGATYMGDLTITDSIAPTTFSALRLEAGDAILDGNAVGNDITVADLIMIANDGIGTVADALDIDVNDLSFVNNNGVVNFSNAGDLTISDSSSNDGSTTTIIGVNPAATLVFDADTSSMGNATYTFGTIDVNSGVVISSLDSLNFATTTVNLNGNLTATNGISGTASTINVLGSTGGAQLQDAVDVAAAGATVNVGAGSFAGGIDINKAITMLGDGFSATTTVNVVDSTAGMTITSSNVTVDGFRFIGDGSPTNANGVWVDGSGGALTGILIGDADADNLGSRFTGLTTGLLVTDGGSGNAIDITVARGNVFDNSVNGMVFNGAGIDIIGNTLNDTAFATMSGNYIELAGGAEFLPGSPTVIDATGASFEGTAASSLTPTQLLAVEGRLVHYLDNPTLGLINLGGHAVTAGNSIQLAVNAAGMIGGAQTVVVDSGTFGGSVEVWVDDLTLLGQGATTIIDTDAVDAYANNGDVNNGFDVVAVSGIALGGGDSTVSGVTIDGFTFDTLTTSGLNIGIELGETGTSTASGTTVQNSFFSDLNHGIVGHNLAGTTTLTGNNINVAGDGIRFDQALSGVTIGITGNMIQGGSNGIEFTAAISGASEVAITGGNTVLGAQEGIRFGGGINLTSGAGIDISGNTSVIGTAAEGVLFNGNVNGPVPILVTGINDSVRFAGEAGGTTALSSLVVSSSGTQTFGGPIAFTGTSSTTTTSAAGNILFNGQSSYDTVNPFTILSMGDVIFNGGLQNRNATGGDINIVAGWDGMTAYNTGAFVAEDVNSTTVFGGGMGSVVIGDGTQVAGVAVGSRSGVTNVFGYDVNLQGGTGAGAAGRFAQLGFQVTDQGAGYVVDGGITVHATHDVAASGGDTTSYNYAQIGHVGADQSFDSNIEATVTSVIELSVGNDVNFLGGGGFAAYAHLGQGGTTTDGNHSGNITISQARDVTFTGGGGSVAYAQLGQGGWGADGNHSGTTTIVQANDVSFTGGEGISAYAQLGQGGAVADGNHSGTTTIVQANDVSFSGGSGGESYAQLGQGGYGAIGNHSGNTTITMANDVSFTGGGNNAYAQLGQGGRLAGGNHSGTTTIVQSNDVSFTGGAGSRAYAQLGHGGIDTNGDHSGAISLTHTGNFTLTGVDVVDQYALIGHGDEPGDGDAGITVNGDVMVRTGGNAILTNAFIGHLIDADGTYTSGNTYIGVGGDLTADAASAFNSAPGGVGVGELRLYVGGNDNVNTATLLNGTAHGGTAFPNNQGAFVYGTGPYVPAVGNFAYYTIQGGIYNYTVDTLAEATAIQTALNGGSDVTLTYNLNQFDFGAEFDWDGGTQFIRFDSDLFYDSTNTLNLLATGDAIFNASVQNSNDTGGDINIVSGWDGTTAYNTATFVAEDVNSTTVFGSGMGSVYVGDGTQVAGVAVGSRSGMTNVFGYDVSLQGGMGAGMDGRFAQLGFQVTDQGAAYMVDGGITVHSTHDVSASGGDTSSYNYVQIGHVGADLAFDTTIEAMANSVIELSVGNDIIFSGGAGFKAYAQLGQGGDGAVGNHNGTTTISQANDVIFTGGGGTASYAQLGQGGYFADGNHSGTITITQTNDVIFMGGLGNFAYAQLGQGGDDADGNHNGTTMISQANDVIFTGGGGTASHAQLGQGGYFADGNHSGTTTITQTNDVIFTGGLGNFAYVQLGQGGDDADGNHSGTTTISQANDVLFTGGGGTASYAQLGQGGYFADGNHSGDFSLTHGGDLILTGADVTDQYALIGHGDEPGDGDNGNTVSGDVMVRTGGDTTLTNAFIGHLIDPDGTYTSGNTFIGVGKGDGSQLLTADASSGFFSATTGELRFYIPRRQSNQIDAGASLNGTPALGPGITPNAQGVYAFGKGPYNLVDPGNFAFYTFPVPPVVPPIVENRVGANLPAIEIDLPDSLFRQDIRFVRPVVFERASWMQWYDYGIEGFVDFLPNGSMYTLGSFEVDPEEGDE